MSTIKKPRAPRKPKSAKVVVADAAATASPVDAVANAAAVVDAAVATAAATAASAEATATPADAKKAHEFASKKLGLVLPIPRVRRLLDDQGINKQVEEAAEALSKATAEAPLAEDVATFLAAAAQTAFQKESDKFSKLKDEKKVGKEAPVLATTPEQLKAVLSGLRYRFSGKAVVMFVAAVDSVIVSAIKEAAAAPAVTVESVGALFRQPQYAIYFTYAHEDSEETNPFLHYVKGFVKDDLKLKWSGAVLREFASAASQLVSQLVPLIRLCAESQSAHTISEGIISFVFQFKLLNARLDYSALVAHMEEKAKLSDKPPKEKAPQADSK